MLGFRKWKRCDRAGFLKPYLYEPLEDLVKTDSESAFLTSSSVMQAQLPENCTLRSVGIETWGRDNNLTPLAKPKHHTANG